MKEVTARRSSVPLWATLLCVCIGLFGAAFAITSLVTTLPANAEGTCGPGKGSETAIVAFFDPVTIGAGTEPPASNATGRSQWSAFINSCQSAANQRAIVAFPVLIVSVAVAIGGPLLLRRRPRGQAGAGAGTMGTGSAGGAAPAWGAPMGAPNPVAVGGWGSEAPAAPPRLASTYPYPPPPPPPGVGRT
jgi:hypothetical protein